MRRFSQGTIAKLKYYVYILVDPRTNEVFYVGKGSSNRVFDHENNIENPDKHTRIQNIINEGFMVKKYIVHSGMSEQKALSAETAIYNFCQAFNNFQSVQLTNVLPPQKNIAPCLDVETIDKLFSPKQLTKKDFVQNERIMLVRIPTTSIKAMVSDEEYLGILKNYASVFSELHKPTVIFSVVKGIIAGAYRIKDWEKEKYKRGKNSFGTRFVPKLINDDFLKKKYFCSDVSMFLPKTSRKKHYRLNY